MIWIGVLCFSAFLVFFIFAIFSLFKKTGKAKRLFLYSLLSFIIFGTVAAIDGSSDEEQTANNVEQLSSDKTETTVEVTGTEKAAPTEDGAFIKFVEDYKMLGTEKTTVWDNQLYGKTVTWSGIIVRAGTSQVFVYGGNDYNGESWSELGDAKKLYYSFVAKYTNGTADEFKKLKNGDRVTIEGVLKSRGDYDFDYNWKIYDAVLK